MKKTTLKDIQTIVKDKDIIENLDYSLLKENPYLSFLFLVIGFSESIFILFTFIPPLEPIGDYAILKILLLHIFIISPILISEILKFTFNYKDYCGLTVKIIKKIFYRFDNNQKNILNKLINIDGYFVSCTPKKIKKILTYYNSLNEKQKKYFTLKSNYQSILKKNIFDYIKNNDIETIKKEKEILTDIIVNNFKNYDIEYIGQLILNKLKEDKEIQRKIFLDNFNNEEQQDIKSNKKVIKEI